MDFELFRFADLSAKMFFVTESDYDSCIGYIKVTDDKGNHFWENFEGHSERDMTIAKAMLHVADNMANRAN